MVLCYQILFAGLPAKPLDQQTDQQPYLLTVGMTVPLYSNKYIHVSHLQISFVLLRNGDKFLKFKIPLLLQFYHTETLKVFKKLSYFYTVPVHPMILPGISWLQHREQKICPHTRQ